MICGEDSLSYSTVRRWVNLFREGRASVQDAPRPGAPKLATNSDKLSEVKEYVDSFPHSSVEDVANNVGISTGSAHDSEVGVGTEEGPSAMGTALPDFSTKGR